MKKKRIQELLEEGRRLIWPEWRLCANFLIREIARLWYGKKSIFRPVKGDKEKAEFWQLFGFILGSAIGRFGETYGLSLDEMDKRFETFNIECQKMGFAFSSPLQMFSELAYRVLGDELGRKFLYDFEIIEIFFLAGAICGYLDEVMMPPYVKGAKIRVIEFYEGLPVAPELEELFYGKNPSPKS